MNLEDNTRQATIGRFGCANTDTTTDSPNSSSEGETPTEPDATPPHSDSEGIPIAPAQLTDPHVRRLVQQLSPDSLRNLTDLDPHSTLVARLQAATDSGRYPRLHNGLDTLTDHTVTDLSQFRDTLTELGQILCCWPFEVSLGDVESQLPTTVSYETTSERVFTGNPSLNSEIINHATRHTAETHDGQRRLREEWEDAIGSETLRTFKQSVEPDALGFALPMQIPATGDDQDTVAITEVPYIGPVTAKELHPTGSLLSLEDFLALSEKQRQHVAIPVDVSRSISSHDRKTVVGIATLASQVNEAESTDAVTLLGQCLGGFSDHRDQETDPFAWINSEKTVALLDGPEFLSQRSLSPVEDIQTAESDETDSESGEKVTVSAQSGLQLSFPAPQWRLLSNLSSELNAEIKLSQPAAILPIPGGHIILGH